MGKTVTGRIWTYVRDDRPFGGHAPPAALYYASRDRKHEHPVQHLQAFTGILQADAYSGYNELYGPSRSQGAITAALCWAHARRQFFELADIAANARRRKNAAAISPVALAAVKRIDALFDIERDINGLSAASATAGIAITVTASTAAPNIRRMLISRTQVAKVNVSRFPELCNLFVTIAR